MASGFCVVCGQESDSLDVAAVCTECGGASAATGGIESATVLADAGGSFPTAESIPDSWEPMPGDVLLDLYQVRDELGRGGMGVVHRVYHRGWDLDLAVKSPLPGVEGFGAEAEAWVDLGLHPHIVTCHYVRHLGGAPRVFAELVEGGSLKDWIDQGGLYEGSEDVVLARLLDVAIQFAWGLGYAHDMGLVHQDVKPANVLLTSDGVVKVTDFGLATAKPVEVESGSGGTIVVAGVGGTPAFFSPEQADAVAQAQAGVAMADRTALTRRTDVWSWAVSVLDMFIGESEPKRYGQSAPDVLEQYVRNGSERDGVPAMPEGVVGLFGECFQRDPDDRPHDFEQVTGRLVDIYKAVSGEMHWRVQPAAADLLADQLNNKALSLLDLDREEEAERLLGEALRSDPHHVEATYNRGLRRWRSGQITDLDLVAQLEEVGKSHLLGWRDEYLLALVHIERGDAESAIELLKAAGKQAPDAPEVEAALARVRADADNWCRLLATWKGHSRHREAVAASPENAGRVLEGIAASLIENMPVGASLDQQDGRWVVAGYDGDVEALAVSPDGQWMASGSQDRTVRIWDVGSGECIRTLQGHEQSVNAVAVSPDGRWVASGGGDTVRLWDIESGQSIRTLEGHDGYVWSLTTSPDGQWLVSGAADMTVRVWDVESGECAQTLLGHTDWVTSLAVSPDGRSLVSGSADQTLRIWDLQSGSSAQTLEGHSGWVWSLAMSPDSRRVISSSDDRTVRTWDLRSGECVQSWPGAGGIAMAVSPDGRWVVSGEEDAVRIWDVGAGRCVRTLQAHSDTVLAVAVSPDGRWVVSGGKDETVRKWRLGFGDAAAAAHAHPQPSKELLLRSAEVDAALNSAAGHLEQGQPAQAALSVARARQIRGFERHLDLLDMTNRIGRVGRRVALNQAWCRHTLVGHTDRVGAVAVSTDGRWVVSGGDRTVRVWDVASGECLQTLGGLAGGPTVRSVAIAPDGRWIVSGMGDKTIRVWDVASGECLQTLQDHDNRVGAVVVSPDGRWVVSGSGDKTVRVWDTVSWECVQTLRAQTDSGPVNSVAMSPDGRWIVSGSEDETVGPLGEVYLYQVRVWDARSGKCVNTLQGHAEAVRSVAVSPDGGWIATGGLDEVLRIWHTAQLNPPAGSGATLSFPEATTLQAHTGWISAVAAVPDSRWVVSGSGDRTVRVWDVESGECVRTMQGHTSYVDAIAVSPDGRWVVSGGGDNTLRIWEFDWEYEFPDPMDWHDGALPLLELFLTQHTPYGPDGLLRQGAPSWSEESAHRLLTELGSRGYGWLRPAGVRAKLEELAAELGRTHEGQ